MHVKSIAIVALLAVVELTSFDARAQDDKTMKRMNFLVIMADDVSPEYYGCYGGKKAKTPTIDRMAEEGVMFRTCWATPICSPTRAMIMTGRYAQRTGWFHNGLKIPHDEHGQSFSKANTPFLKLLKDHDYATALAGKWQMLDSIRAESHGIDEYCIWSINEKDLPEGATFSGARENESVLSRYWHPAMVQNDKLLPTKEDDFGPDIDTKFLIDFMKRNKDKPFCAYYPMILPHDTRIGFSTVPGRGAVGELAKGNLQDNTDYTDTLVARLLNALTELGLRENTLIIYTSDNGRPGKNHSSDKGALVPLVIDGPGVIKARGKVDELASLADIWPTLAEFAGIDLKGYQVDGQSMKPFLTGASDKHRDWLYSYVGTARMVRDRRWILEGVDAVGGQPHGRFYDTSGDKRKDVSASKDEEVLAARKHFQEILDRYPAPDPSDPEINALITRYKRYKYAHINGKRRKRRR